MQIGAPLKEVHVEPLKNPVPVSEPTPEPTRADPVPVPPSREPVPA